MLPEQRGLLGSLFSRFRRDAAKSRKRPRRGRPLGWQTSIEELEDRRLLVSRVWLDFGDAFPGVTGGPLAGWTAMRGVQPAALDAALNGAGAGQTFKDQLGIIADGVTINPPYN